MDSDKARHMLLNKIPPQGPNAAGVEPFFYWINERHSIYQKRRLGQPWPWTQDRILQEYRFCNVFRELDTVTQWVAQAVRPIRHADHLWHMLLTARFINWPDTLAEIMQKGAWYPAGEYHWQTIANVMHARAARGEQVWTNAYTVSTNGVKRNKPDYICDHVLGGAWAKRDTLAAAAHTTLEDFCKAAQQVDGIGGFMAYEVACDLRWCPGWLNTAADIHTWANPGPGAKRGLNRIFGRPLDKGMTVEQANVEMRYLLDMSLLFLGDHVPVLEMRDIEHSLCETDKYLRVQNNEGAPRSKYRRPA